MDVSPASVTSTAQWTDSAILFLGSVSARKPKDFSVTPAENTFTAWMPPVVRPVTVMWRVPVWDGLWCLDRTVCLQAQCWGERCSECVEGYFYQRQNHSFLCLPCSCDRTGTINGSLLCDKSTGQCPCKLGVTGLHCNQCEPHRYNLTVGSFQGCQMCECDPWGHYRGTFVTHSVASAMFACLVVKKV